VHRIKRSTTSGQRYAVHPEVRHRRVAGRINDEPAPLESMLANGDVVEVVTSKSPTASPTWDWLRFVRTPRP